MKLCSQQKPAKHRNPTNPLVIILRQYTQLSVPCCPLVLLYNDTARQFHLRQIYL